MLQAAGYLPRLRAVRETEQILADAADERAHAMERLHWWQQDPALASVRDAAALELLLADQRGRNSGEKWRPSGNDNPTSSFARSR